MGVDKYTVIPVSCINVLVVDRDVTCLAIISKMLQILGYQVIIAIRAYDVFKIIENTKIHLVIMDLHLSNMGFYDLIEIIEEKYGIPSFAMTADEDHNSVLQALGKGAKLCFRKPLLFSDINNLWQFALWRRKNETFSFEHLGTLKNEQEWQNPNSKGKLILQRDTKKKRKEKEVVVVEDKGGEENEAQVKKRQRISWTENLHNKFVEAVNLAGIDAPPKKIHQYMDVPGITKLHVSSYLQKYRQTMRQKAVKTHHLTDTNSSDSNLGSLSLPYKGLLGVNPMEVHGNLACVPTMKTPSVVDSPFGENQLSLQMTLQGTANGPSSSFGEFNMNANWAAPPKASSGENLVHWANREALIELGPIESATNGSVLNEGALLSGVDHKTTATITLPYIDIWDQLFESDNTSTVDHTAGKSEMQRSTLPANNDMSQQFPQQLPVQPAPPSYEKKLDFLDAEFGDIDELFNMSKETMEVYEDLGAWLSNI